MHTDTEYLKNVAKEVSSPKNALKYKTLPDHRLVLEAKRLEKAIAAHLLSIDNFTQRDTFYFDISNKLIAICDTLYAAQNNLSPNTEILVNLLNAIKQVIPSEVRPNLKLPKAFLPLQMPQMKGSLEKHLALFRENNIDPDLVAIAKIPFEQFFDRSKDHYWGNYTWMKSYLAKLDALDWAHADCESPTEALVSLLISADFNHHRFFVYCKKMIIDRVASKTGKQEKLRELAKCRKLVLQDATGKTAPYIYNEHCIVGQLMRWINAEKKFISEHEREHPFAKLSFQLYKYTLAFFFKLLHEQKVFGDITFRELSEQIASTCTAMGADVPAETMIKKAYLKKQVDFRAIENLLVKMLEYIRSFMPKA